MPRPLWGVLKARTASGRLDAVGLALLVLAVHLRSLGFGFTGLDDRDLLVDDHAFLTSANGWLEAFRRSYWNVVDARHPYYRPLVTLSYALDARWSGVLPFGYHATNLALHLVASLLVWALLRRGPLSRGVAFAGAAAFAVHPALASTVAWIPGRNDSLLAVLVLASWLAFTRALARPSWGWCAAHLALFWLALLAKETALVLPLVCLAQAWLIGAPGQAGDPPGRGDRGLGATFGALGASRFAVVIAGWAAGLGLRAWLHPVSPPALLESAGHVPLVFAALADLVFPVHPSLLGASDRPVWPGVLAAAVLLAMALRLPAARRRTVALGGAAFFLFLAPSLAVPGSLVLEQRLYLPAVGVVLAVAEIARALALERGVAVASTLALLLALVALTAGYEGTFHDRRSFARSAVESAPRAPLAHVCLAQSLQLDGDASGALGEYRTALLLGSVYTVHNNIAVLEMARGRWPEAERELDAELAVDPRSVRARRNLAVVLRHEGRLDEAAAADARADAIQRGQD